MFCTACGQPVADDANFCTNCGTRQPVLSPSTLVSARLAKGPQPNAAGSSVISSTVYFAAGTNQSDQHPLVPYGVGATARSEEPQSQVLSSPAKAKANPGNASICPYCRVLIDPATDSVIVCEHCETPHHCDCYQENGGCTVFGCQCAPTDEPKLRVSSPELDRAYVPPLTPSDDAVQESVELSASTIFSPPDNHKPKIIFIFLGVILGFLGAHNFYAGYSKKGVIQFGITVFTLGYGAPMSWIWAIIDICTIDCDSRGVQFKS